MESGIVISLIESPALYKGMGDSGYGLLLIWLFVERVGTRTSKWFQFLHLESEDERVLQYKTWQRAAFHTLGW